MVALKDYQQKLKMQFISDWIDASSCRIKMSKSFLNISFGTKIYYFASESMDHNQLENNHCIWIVMWIVGFYL